MINTLKSCLLAAPDTREDILVVVQAVVWAGHVAAQVGGVVRPVQAVGDQRTRQAWGCVYQFKKTVQHYTPHCCQSIRLGTMATSWLVSRSWKSSLEVKMYIMFIANYSHLLLFRTGVDPGFLLRQSQARDSGQEERQEGVMAGLGWLGCQWGVFQWVGFYTFFTWHLYLTLYQHFSTEWFAKIELSFIYIEF